MIVHRHLDIPSGTPPDRLPLDALDDLLDRGDIGDWRELAAAVRRDPHGPLADRVLALCRAHAMYGTSQLWPAFIERLRSTDDGGRPPSLAEVRKQRGKTQAQVAAALGIDQSDVSKLERRRDLRVSTLRRYLRALGGELELTARFPSEAPVPVSLPGDAAATTP